MSLCSLLSTLISNTVLFSTSGRSTPYPLSVQVFTLSPLPFIFTVSILTTSSSPAISVACYFFPPVVNFCLWHRFFNITLPFQTLSRWDFFLAVSRMFFCPFPVCSEFYCPLYLVALLLPLISHSRCLSIYSLIKYNYFILCSITKPIHDNLSLLPKYLYFSGLISNHPFADSETNLLNSSSLSLTISSSNLSHFTCFMSPNL